MTQKEISQKKKALEQLWGTYVRGGAEGWLKFMRDELKYQPDDKIAIAVNDIAGHNDTAVKSSHGVGKTACGAVCLLTAEALTPSLITIQLSPTWRQVNKIFWNEVRKWAGNSKLMKELFWMPPKGPEIRSIVNPHAWYAVGLASDMPGAVEGFHGKRVMLFVDEAKTVKDGMIQAVEGALTADDVWRAYFSTPSTPGGEYTEFYNAFSKNKQKFKRHTITAYESPRVNRKWVEMMIAKYGIDNPLVRMKVFAEFVEVSDDMLIPLSLAERFFQDDIPEWNPKKQSGSMGIDVARYGLDESVVSIWGGGALRVLSPFVGKNTVELAQLAFSMARTHNVRTIVIDDIGVGGGVTDRLIEIRDNAHYDCNVVGFNASRRANDEKTYKNIGDEVWCQFAEALASGEAKSAVQDDTLVYQLSSYLRHYTPDNRINIQWPKRNKRNSDSNSPDRGDSVVMGWYAQTVGAWNPAEDVREIYEEIGDDSPIFGGVFGRDL